jgi:hypothetical protein
MNPLLPVTVTVACGGRRTELSFGTVVKLLGHDAAAKLVGAVFVGRRAQAIHSQNGEEGGRGKKGQELFPVTNAVQNQNYENALRLGEEASGGVGEEGERAAQTAAPVDDNERLADYLATRLGDEKSLAFYGLVARSVPREVIGDALSRALDVPRQNVRRSRAALFTALIRPHLPRTPRRLSDR